MVEWGGDWGRVDSSAIPMLRLYAEVCVLWFVGCGSPMTKLGISALLGSSLNGSNIGGRGVGQILGDNILASVAALVGNTIDCLGGAVVSRMRVIHREIYGSMEEMMREEYGTWGNEGEGREERGKHVTRRWRL